MAIKVADAAVLLKTRMQVALQACAPARGVTDWLDEIADEIDYAHSSLRALYYGQAVNVPKGGVVYALLGHPKLGARFRRELLGPLLPDGADMDLSAEIARVEDALAALRARHAPGEGGARRRGCRP